MSQEQLWPEKVERREPRPYQRKAFEANVAAWAAGARGVLNVLATGLGKTYVGTLHAADQGQGWTLWVAPKRELVEQAAADYQQTTGRRAGIDMAELESYGESFVSGTVDTIHRRLGKYERNPPSMIVLDECHHAAASTWQKIVKYPPFKKAKVLGLTATPDRGDGKALDGTFDATTTSLQVDWAWEQSWLVPAIGRTVDAGKNDLRKIKQQGGDFDSGELARAISAAHESMVDKVLETFREPEIGERSTIFFAPSKDAAHEIAAFFCSRRAGMAVAVDGEMPRAERKDAFDAIRTGSALVIVNFGVIVEGVDVPNVSNVVFGRPTRKRWLAVQMGGRGLRAQHRLLDGHVHSDPPTRAAAIAGSKKPNCLWTDFVWLSRHKLVTPVRLALGGCEGSERVVARAEKESRAGVTDLAAAIGRAKKVEDKLERSRLARQRASKERLGIDLKSYDPMAGATEEGTDISPGRRNQPTLAMGNRLVQFGVSPEDIAKMDRGQAGSLLGKLHDRRKRGLATHRQLKAMSKLNLPNQERISFALASRILDAWKKHGKERVEASRRVRSAIDLDTGNDSS